MHRRPLLAAAVAAFAAVTLPLLAAGPAVAATPSVVSLSATSPGHNEVRASWTPVSGYSTEVQLFFSPRCDGTWISYEPATAVPYPTSSYDWGAYVPSRGCARVSAWLYGNGSAGAVTTTQLQVQTGSIQQSSSGWVMNAKGVGSDQHMGVSAWYDTTLTGTVRLWADTRRSKPASGSVRIYYCQVQPTYTCGSPTYVTASVNGNGAISATGPIPNMPVSGDANGVSSPGIGGIEVYSKTAKMVDFSFSYPM